MAADREDSMVSLSSRLLERERREPVRRHPALSASVEAPPSVWCAAYGERLREQREAIEDRIGRRTQRFVAAHSGITIRSSANEFFAPGTASKPGRH